MRQPVLALGITAAFFCATFFGGVASAESDEATHEALRELRDQMVSAWEAKDIDRLLSFVDEEAVVTWQNGEVNRGPAGVRAFYERMMLGDDPVIADVESRVEVDRLSTLHGGDTAVAHGSMQDRWVLTDGLEMELESRWTATLVRKAGAWKLASYHTSTNLFDNPLLNAATASVMRSGLVGAGIGLLLGAGIGWAIWRRR